MGTETKKTRYYISSLLLSCKKNNPLDGDGNYNIHY